MEEELSKVNNEWKVKVAALYRNLKETYESEIASLKNMNGSLEKKIESLRVKKTNLKVKIAEAECEFKEARLREQQAQAMQKQIMEELETLRNKQHEKTKENLQPTMTVNETALYRMQTQIEYLKNEKERQSSHMDEMRKYIVNQKDSINQEKNFRSKVQDYLDKILDPTIKRKGGGYEIDYMHREEARILVGIAKNLFHKEIGKNMEDEMPRFLQDA